MSAAVSGVFTRRSRAYFFVVFTIPTHSQLIHPISIRSESGVDQLVEIIKVLGTPSKEQIREMNPHYTEFKFPQIKAHPWYKVGDALATFGFLSQL